MQDDHLINEQLELFLLSKYRLIILSLSRFRDDYHN